MSKKTLKFNNIRVIKKEFNKSKQSIDLDLVTVDQIVGSNEFRHSDDSFKYFIGYQEGEIVKPLFIIVPQMMVKDINICNKYNEIWGKIKEKLNIKFHSMPVYNQTYIKAKVREFDGVIKTNFLVNELPKENMHYTSIACITIDSLMKMEEKNYLQVYLEECKYKLKKYKCLDS